MNCSSVRALAVPLAALLLVPALACGDRRSTAGDGSASADAPRAELPPAALARREAHRDALRTRLGPDYDAPLGVEFDADRLKRGARLYGQLCAACHGMYGRGDGATASALAMRPADLSDPAMADFYSERATLEILREGVPGTPMLGWDEALPEPDLINLTLYVRSLSRAVGDAR